MEKAKSMTNFVSDDADLGAVCFSQKNMLQINYFPYPVTIGPNAHVLLGPLGLTTNIAPASWSSCGKVQLVLGSGILLECDACLCLPKFHGFQDQLLCCGSYANKIDNFN